MARQKKRTRCDFCGSHVLHALRFSPDNNSSLSVDCCLKCLRKLTLLGYLRTEAPARVVKISVEEEVFNHMFDSYMKSTDM